MPLGYNSRVSSPSGSTKTRCEVRSAKRTTYPQLRDSNAALSFLSHRKNSRVMQGLSNNVLGTFIVCTPMTRHLTWVILTLADNRKYRSGVWPWLYLQARKSTVRPSIRSGVPVFSRPVVNGNSRKRAASVLAVSHRHAPLHHDGHRYEFFRQEMFQPSAPPLAHKMKHPFV